MLLFVLLRLFSVVTCHVSTDTHCVFLNAFLYHQACKSYEEVNTLYVTGVSWTWASSKLIKLVITFIVGWTLKFYMLFSFKKFLILDLIVSVGGWIFSFQNKSLFLSWTWSMSGTISCSFMKPFSGIYKIHKIKSLQELRCREEDLNRAQLQQRMHEEQLRQKEQELHAREIDLLERELDFMIKQQTPTPLKRKGKICRIKVWHTLCISLLYL